MSTFQQILLIAVVVTTWAWISSGEHDDEIENEEALLLDDLYL